MNTVSRLTLTVLIAVIGSFLTAGFLFGFRGVNRYRIDDLRTRADRFDRELAKLRDENRALNHRLNAENRVAADPEAFKDREPVASLAAAVDRWMREHRPELLGEEDLTGPDTSAGEISEEAEVRRAAELLALLDEPGMDDEAWNEVWKKISEAGVMEEALALLEQGVERDPTNPDAHLALAGGYFGMSVNTANDMEKGLWAIKADKVLDRAIELDPWHWEARFTKAVGLSYYPPAMGKQAEAMKHLSILEEQQRKLPRNPRYAQTYLYLGNLHLQMGEKDKAIASWKEGLERYPDCAELAAQLDHMTKP